MLDILVPEIGLERPRIVALVTSMQRREFITVLCGAAAWPMTARAQQPERMRRIGVFLPSRADDAVFR